MRPRRFPVASESKHPLSQRRIALGLSQADLANRAGVNARTVDRIEKHHNEPSFKTTRLLAEALGCSVADLIPPEGVA